MGTQWMPSATRDSRAWSRNPMSRTTSALRMIVHSTENSVGTDPMAVVNYMASNAGLSTGYHVVLPLEGGHRPVQLREFSYAAGSLYNNGSCRVSPNKEGTVLLQVAVVAYAKDNPCCGDLGPWWPELLDCVRSWGVPDAWMGPMPPGGGQKAPMSQSQWYSPESGWLAHATAYNPGSSHWDPGKVDPARMFGGTGGGSSPVPPPSDGFTLVYA